MSTGIFWQQPVKVGRTAAQKAKPRAAVTYKMDTTGRALLRPGAPADYRPPTHFPCISQAQAISIDFETHDPELKTKGPGAFRDGYVVGVAVCTEDWDGDYYPIAHRYGPNCEPGRVFEWLRDELTNFSGYIIGTNLLYELQYLAANGVRLNGKPQLRDVQIAEPLLDEYADNYKLERLAQKWLGQGKVRDDITRLYGTGWIQAVRDVHPAHLAPYVLGDVRLPFDILHLQEQELARQDLTELFEMECALLPMLLYMREQGVRVDVTKAEEIAQAVQKQQREGAAQLRHIAGRDVSIWANQSVARAFDDAAISYPRTKRGEPSFRQQWLENHPSDLARTIVNLRKLEKFDSTFIKGYILENSQNGRIHAQFHPLRNAENGSGMYGTVSGRFSSSNPNLQNIPVRDEILGPMIRGMFIPEDGCRWWSADYSQIEYRFLVHYAYAAHCLGAEIARERYAQDRKTDYHVMVAELTNLQRKKAKNINFGLVYGMGKNTLAYNLGLSLEEAEPIFAAYHAGVPFVRQLFNMAVNKALNAGFVRTVLKRMARFILFEPVRWDGEQRAVPLPYDAAVAAYGNVRRAMTHKALNRVLQGSAADLAKRAMVDIWDAGLIGPSAPLQCHLTVHDELDGSENCTEQAAAALAELKQLMETAIPLHVPVLVELGTGANWAEAH